MRILKVNCFLLIGVVCLITTGCMDAKMVRDEAKTVDKLYVYADGTMVFNNRYYSEDEVVIYPDGFGGEKAAVKMHVPLHPSYYRDSIIVERKASNEPVIN